MTKTIEEHRKNLPASDTGDGNFFTAPSFIRRCSCPAARIGCGLWPPNRTRARRFGRASAGMPWPVARIGARRLPRCCKASATAPRACSCETSILGWGITSSSGRRKAVRPAAARKERPAFADRSGWSVPPHSGQLFGAAADAAPGQTIQFKAKTGRNKACFTLEKALPAGRPARAEAAGFPPRHRRFAHTSAPWHASGRRAICQARAEG